MSPRKTARKDPTVIGREIQELPCQLTQEERLAKARQASTLRFENIEAKAALSEHQKEVRETIARREREADKLLGAVRSGQEHRQVMVELATEKDELVTRRTDTGEVVSRRPLTDAERQGHLYEMGETMAEQLAPETGAEA